MHGDNRPREGDATAVPPAAAQADARDPQVFWLVKMLELKGSAAAAELRQRIRDGRGFTVRGRFFSVSHVEIALQKWQSSMK